MANYSGSCEECVHYRVESKSEVMGQCDLVMAPCIAQALGLDSQYDQNAQEFLTYPSWSCSFGSYSE